MRIRSSPWLPLRLRSFFSISLMTCDDVAHIPSQAVRRQA
jgi:hypothetical protein